MSTKAISLLVDEGSSWRHTSMRTQNLLTNSGRSVSSVLEYIVFGSVIFYLEERYLFPCFALLISFVLYPVCAWLERRGTGRLLAISIAIS